MNYRQPTRVGLRAGSVGFLIGHAAACRGRGEQTADDSNPPAARRSAMTICGLYRICHRVRIRPVARNLMQGGAK